MLTSARRGINYPNSDRSDRPDPAVHIGNLIPALEEDVVFQQGTDAARLAASHYPDGGLFWWTTDTKLMWYDDGTNWQSLTPVSPGTELDYAQITTTVTLNGSIQVIGGDAKTYDGSRVKIEFFAPYVGTAQSAVVFSVYRDGTNIGNVAQVYNNTSQVGNDNAPVYAATFDTPSAGSHTYAIYSSGGGGNAKLICDVGGGNVGVPAYLRVTKA